MTEHKKGGVLITGSSSGIGRACALLLDRLGYLVFAGVRKPEAGEQLRLEASERLSPVLLDITDPSHITRAVDVVRTSLRSELPLKGIVNNAGVSMAGPTELFPIDMVRRHLEVNLIGHIAVTQAFLPIIRKGRGRIINIGSAAGRFALPFFSAYAASKFGLVGFTDSLRRELRPWGIPVSILELGTVDTPMWDKTAADTLELDATYPAEVKELYQVSLPAMAKVMENGRRRALTPGAVAELVRQVLEAPRPKTRYRMGPGTRMSPLASLIPDRFTDWVIAKVLAQKLTPRALW
jgi:NAD(P)-dependent dehydrogenase (short-subunit alcohol dehydrogenase family)